MNLSGKVGIEAQHLGAQRAAQAGQAGAEGEGGQEHDVDVDAQAGGDALVVDRGAQAAAEARARQDELQPTVSAAQTAMMNSGSGPCPASAPISVRPFSQPAAA
jgi:hypothetical protein